MEEGRISDYSLSADPEVMIVNPDNKMHRDIR
jgi:hypothetical protein